MSEKNINWQEKSISNRIEAVRLHHNLTQEEFCSIVFMPPFFSSEIENLKNNQSMAILKLICYEFKVSLKWLITGQLQPSDPEYLKKPNNSVFENTTTVMEAVSCYLLNEKNLDHFSDSTYTFLEYNLEKYGKQIKKEFEIEFERDIFDAFHLANWDGYNFGFKAATELIKSFFNLDNLPIKNENLNYKPKTKRKAI